MKNSARAAAKASGGIPGGAEAPGIDVLPQPVRRPLKIFAFDPMLGRAARNRISIDVPNEPLAPGPVGARLEVIDYDASNRLVYPAVDLNDPAVLMAGGLDPTEAEPRFHQQMVYAVGSRVIENFERALGRRWAFRGNDPLRIYPHAFDGRNAYYHSKLKALLFGYFRADPDDPGPNIPGQTIYTCLSHDIVAHEMAHAMVDRMREHFLEPSNPDTLAFHEGFADIIAILQHFSFSGLLRETIAKQRTDLRTPGPMLELASEFGFATGRRSALRSALDPDAAPDAQLYNATVEPHGRGSVLVRAVFDAFFSTYQARIADLLRISGEGAATSEHELHPDLVGRVADEAAKTAQNVLTMCIRAFEYLPPVDVTYGDYLRALVTADFEVVPDDPLEQRNALIEAFRVRGIVPRGVGSLALNALLWPARTISEPLPRQDVVDELEAGAHAFTTTGQSNLRQWDPRAMDAWAVRNADELDLDPARPIKVQGFHALYRVTREGQLRIELVVQFLQTVGDKEFVGLAGVPLRGGTTVVASSDGEVRYVISKPLPRLRPLGTADERAVHAEARLASQQAFVEEADLTDARAAFDTQQYLARRMSARMSLARLHRGLL